MALYTDIVMDHFMNPRNVGSIENADGVGEVGNAKCGDIMKMYLKIKDNKIEDVKFETFGCGTRTSSTRWADFPRTSSTALCLPRRRSNLPSRIITTKTALPTTRRSSPNVRTASPAAWYN